MYTLKTAIPASLGLLGIATTCLSFSHAAGAPQRIRKGEAIFRQKCTGCHAVNGEGGHFCPDLGRVGAMHSRDYLEQKLRNPRRTNPSSIMPTFGYLPRDQFDSLVRYLEQLR